MNSARTTMGAKLIGIQYNFFHPTGNTPVSRPTKCFFLAEDGSLKWVAVNSSVFPGWWSMEDTSNLVFPPFPTGSWNVGQISRLENGEVAFTKTLEIPFEGIENAWHPTKIDITELELVKQFKYPHDGRLWYAKHPRFNDKPLFVKIEPWACSTARKGVMEIETKAYEMLYGLGMTPEFLGHVTYRGAVIGFILEWVEGARTAEDKDTPACIEAIKKLHSLGLVHGYPHHGNFMVKGNDLLVIDFEHAKIGDKATVKEKEDDIRHITREFEEETWRWRLEMGEDEDEDDDVPDVDKFFDGMVDDEIPWVGDDDDF
ncbi:hypothetical protein F5Y09DRAFT_336041 [Xylaria sp. FL1042]|nr:hypothetical protein F5Y09DRAFT_336041 [Xylaria sp. FL1042]